MPRVYKRKTARALTSPREVKTAVDAVLNGEMKVPTAANLYDIPVKSLYRYCKKAENGN